MFNVLQCEAIDIFCVPNSEAIDVFGIPQSKANEVPMLARAFELQKHFSECFKSHMKFSHLYSTQGVQMLHISKVVESL